MTANRRSLDGSQTNQDRAHSTRGDENGPAQHSESPRFYSVSEAAKIVRTAPVTLYRAIREGEFPAVRIRGRLIVPARALDAMVSTAIAEGSLVDAAEWGPDAGTVR